MENPVDYGKVVDLIEERPVCRDSKGALLAGNTQQFLDLLLRNAKGDEKVVRVAVGPDVVDFFAAGSPDPIAAE